MKYIFIFLFIFALVGCVQKDATSLKSSRVSNSVVTSSASFDLTGVPSLINANLSTTLSIMVTPKKAEFKAYRYKIGNTSMDCASNAGYSVNPISFSVPIGDDVAYFTSNSKDKNTKLCLIGVDANYNSQPLSEATSVTWLLDIRPPTAALIDTPKAVDNAVVLNSKLDLTSGPDIESYRYKIGYASTTICNSASDYSSLVPAATPISDSIESFADGDLKLCVVAIDKAGNAQDFNSATSFIWTKDSTPPTAILVGAPTGTNNSTGLDIIVSATPQLGYVSYRYKVGTARDVNCASNNGYSAPVASSQHIISSLAPLPDGTYRVCALAIDNQGNQQSLQSATALTWIKNTVSPSATLAGAPSIYSNTNKLNVAVSSTDTANFLSYKYKLGPSVSTDCSDVANYSGIIANSTPITDSLSAYQDGQLKLCVLTFSYTSTTKAVVTVAQWTKDTVAPSAVLSNVPTKINNITGSLIGIGVSAAVASDIYSYRYKYGNSATIDCSIDVNYSSSFPLATYPTITADVSAFGSNASSANTKICVLAKDAAGNEQLVSAATSASWITDLTPPLATLAGAPTGTNNANSINVKVNSVDADYGSYKFKIGSAASTDCSTSVGYSIEKNKNTNIVYDLNTFSDGTMKLCVVAIDTNGNQQPLASATVATWVKDTTAPTAVLSNVPSGINNTAVLDISVTSTSTDFSSYQYKVGIGSINCSSSTGYITQSNPATHITTDISSSLAEGPIKICVVALDSLGNQQSYATATTASWTKDTTAPSAIAVGIPTGSSSVFKIDASISALVPTDIASYRYKLGVAPQICTDSAGYSAPTSIVTHLTATLDPLIAGGMTLCLVGIDAAGNAQAFTSPTVYNWTKVAIDPNDTTAPTAVLANVPSGTNNTKVLNVSVSATVPSDIASYRYKIGPTSASLCSTSTGYSASQPGATPITASIANLPDGSLTLCVVAADPIPNEQSISIATTATWIKDTQAPTALIAGAPTGTNKTLALNATVSSSASDFVSYLYKVGESATTDCGSSANYKSQLSSASITDSLSAISDGMVKLCVLAVDTLGNTQAYATASSVQWIKDTTAPALLIINAPKATNNATAIDVTISSTDSDYAGYKFKFGEASKIDCSVSTGYTTVNSTSTHIVGSLSAMADGLIRICTLGFDNLGNMQSSANATIAEWTKDTTAPLAILNQAPSGTTPDTALNVTVTSSSADFVSYKYKLGASATTDCASSSGYSIAIPANSPITNSLSKLADGDLRLCAIAIDSMGNEQSYASATVANWTKDTTPPVAILSGAPTGSSTSATLNVAVSSLIPGDVVSYQYVLYPNTSNTSFCSYSSYYSSDTPAATPISFDLSSYTGSTPFVLCVVAKDQYGNQQSYLNATFATWTRDVQAPIAVLTGVPSATSNATALNVTVSSSSSDFVSYKYKLGVSTLTNCSIQTGYSATAISASTPITDSLTTFADGVLRLCVLGIDSLGNQQSLASATAATWTKDTTAPALAITSAPTGVNKTVVISASVTSTDADYTYYKYKMGLKASTDCSVASGYSVQTPVGTPISSNLSLAVDGDYIICAIGLDAVGNQTAYANATSVTWTKDTTPPTAIVTGVPSGTSSVKNIDAVVSAAEADYFKYRYKIGNSTTNCSVVTGYSVFTVGTTHITKDLSTLADGLIVLCVIASDNLGNEQILSSATTYSWTKVSPQPGDVTAPVATIIGAPSGISNANSLNVTVSAVDPIDIATYRYKVVAGANADCSNNLNYSAATPASTPITGSLAALPDGVLTLCVVASDAVPNDQPLTSASSVSWTKDTTPPTAIILSAPVAVNNTTKLNAYIDNSSGDIVSYKYKLLANTIDTTQCAVSTGYSADIPVATKMTDTLSTFGQEVQFVLCAIGKDAAGNYQSYASANATAKTWMMDTLAPIATLAGAPTGSSMVRLLSIAVGSSAADLAAYRYKIGPSASTQCNVDSNYILVPSSTTLITDNIKTLADGPITLCVLARDTLANEQSLASATAATWTKISPAPGDVTAPIATLAGYPVGTNNSKVLDIAVSAVDPLDIASYRYKIGPVATTVCSTDTAYSADVSGSTHITDSIASLPDGDLRLCVLASDAVPNEQALASATTVSWKKDTIAPVADLAGAPTGSSNTTAVDIAVSSAALDYLNYKYKLGEGANTDCSLMSGYSAAIAGTTHITNSIATMADGPIKLCALAIDGAGNLQSSATVATWTKDTTAPVAHLLGTPSGSVALNAVNITVDNLNPSDIVSYKYKILTDTSDVSLCTDPSGYSNSIPVATNITNDLTLLPHESSMVLCVIGKDSTGNEQSVMNPTSASWYNDITSPVAVINGAPTGVNTTYILDVTISSTSTDLKTYNYKVGPSSSTDCSSSTNYLSPVTPLGKISTSLTSLPDGDLTLCVVAIDNVGNKQPFAQATTATWTKDITPPVAILSGAPAGSSSVTSIDVIVDATVPSDIVSYRYKFGNSSTNCTSSFGYSAQPIPSSTHIVASLSAYPDNTTLVLCAVGIDAVGNQQPYATATSRSWTKVGATPGDTTPPTATLANYPTGISNVKTLNVTVSATVPSDISSYRYALGDGSLDCSVAANYGSSSPATTPITASLTSLADSTIKLCVIGMDASLNEQLPVNATSVTWTKDTTSPTIAVNGAPTGTNNATALDVTVTSTDADYVNYKYKVGPVASTNCGDTTNYLLGVTGSTHITSSLSFGDGDLLLCVLGVDSRGNTQLPVNATVKTWTKDTLAPVAVLKNTPYGFDATTVLSVDIDNVLPVDLVSYKYKILTGTNNTADCATASGYSSEWPKATLITDDLSAVASGTQMLLCVIGKDGAGNWQSTVGASTAVWTRDVIPPVATISGVPTGTSGVINLDVTVSATVPTDLNKYMYKIEPTASVDCTSMTGYSTLKSNTAHITDNISSIADGDVTLCVIAYDFAYNKQVTPTSAHWIKVGPTPGDTTPPTATVAGLPASSPNNVTSFDLTVSATVPTDIASYRYKFGLTATTTCTDSAGYSNSTPITTHIISTLSSSDGDYTLCVIGTDPSGNVQPFSTPSVYSWTKDTIAPIAKLSNTPAARSSDTALNITVGSTAADFTKYIYKVGPTATLSACSNLADYSSPKDPNVLVTDSLSAVADGSITLCVLGMDAVPNQQALSGATSYTWVKDTTGPAVAVTGAPSGASNTLVLNVGVTSLDNDFANYKYKVGPSSSTTCSVSTGYTTANAKTDLIKTDISSLADGAMRLCVLGIDTSGNQTLLTNAADVTWTKDTANPIAVLINAPTEASTNAIKLLDITVDNLLSGGAISYRYKLTTGTLADAPTACSTITGYSSQDVPIATKITDNLETYGSVASFILCVIAKDSAGNVQASPTIRTWNKDTLAPIAIVAGLPSSASNQKALSFTVTASTPSDITSYVYKFVPTSASVCSSSAGYTTTPTSVANPTSLDLSSSSDGSYTVCVLGTDSLGNQQALASATTVTWTLDTVAPTISLTNAPSGTTKQTQYGITVSGNADLANYKYKAGLAADTICTDTANYGALTSKDTLISINLLASPDADYKLCVLGYDLAGNESAATSATWTKDTFAPKTILSGLPASPSNSTTLNVTVSATVPADLITYKYKLGAASSVDCAVNSGADSYSSAVDKSILITSSIAGLPDGLVKLCVIGTDSVGNEQALSSATSATWTKDTAGPVALISGAPTGTSSARRLNVTVSSSIVGDISTYMYKVGTSASTTCTNPSGYSAAPGTSVATKITTDLTSIADGSITLCVLGLDSLGNQQDVASASSASWTKVTYANDTTAPIAILSGAPASTSNATKLDIALSAADPIDFISYRYKIVTLASDCTNKASGYSSDVPASVHITDTLPTTDGSYTVCVLASDAVPNEQATATTYTWTKDTTAPTLSLSGLPPQFSNSTSVNIGVTSAATDFTSYKYKILPSSSINSACGVSTGYSAAINKTVGITDSLASDGLYRLCIVGIDSVGNEQTLATAVTNAYTWTKDTLAPTAVLLNAPSGTTGDTALNVTIDQLTPGDIATYKYKIKNNPYDGGSINLATCSDPAGYSASDIPVNTAITDSLTKYKLGSTTYLCVWAKDKAGNQLAVTGATTASWMKGKPTPTAVLAGLPAASSNVTALNISVGDSGTNNIANYKYKIGPKATTSCASSANYSAAIKNTTNITDNISTLADGDLTICAVAIDGSGNQQSFLTATTYTWTKDTVTPTAIFKADPNASNYPNTLRVLVSATVSADIKTYLYKIGGASTDCTKTNGYLGPYPATQAISEDMTKFQDNTTLVMCARATDAAGNQQTLANATTASWLFNSSLPNGGADLTAPVAVLSNVPLVINSATSTLLNIAVSAVDPNDIIQYKYAIINPQLTTCLDPMVYSAPQSSVLAITDNVTTFNTDTGMNNTRVCVVAMDRFNNQQSFETATTAEWITDLNAPKVILANAPSGDNSSLSLSVGVSSSVLGELKTYKYKLINKSSNISDCANDAKGTWSGDVNSSTYITDSLSTITVGDSTVLCVKGKDVAGNEQSSANATSTTWKKVSTCGNGASTFAGGSGNSYDPYLINNVTQLQAINTFPSCSFKLNADLNMTGVSILPIASGATAFTGGVFDGNNHKISNLKIQSNTSGNIGLFAKATGTIFKDLILENVDMVGVDHVGALVAEATNVVIMRTSASGTIVATSATSYAGGLVAKMFNSDFKSGMFNSSSSVNVTAQLGSAGGLVGYLQLGDVTNTENFSTGIRDSFSTSSVTAAINAGGLVADVKAYNNHIYAIYNSYASGAINANSSGGLFATQNITSAGHGAIQSFAATTMPAGAIGAIAKQSVWEVDSTPYYDVYWDVVTMGLGDCEDTSVLSYTGDKCAGQTLGANYFYDSTHVPFNTNGNQNWNKNNIWSFTASALPTLRTSSWVAPVAQGGTYSVAPTGTVTVKLNAYSFDRLPIFYQFVSQPKGKLSNFDSVNLTYTYTPPAHKFGGYIDSFSYVAVDSNGMSSEVTTVTIKVTTGCDPSPTLSFSGFGTLANPYVISTVDELQSIHDVGDCYYSLAGDIDLLGAEFKPLFKDSSIGYTKTFLGNGYNIKNWTYKHPYESNIGFFSRLEPTAIVQALVVTNAFIEGYSNVGIMTGYNNGATISYGLTGGSVTGYSGWNGSAVGGFVGYSKGGTIDRSNSLGHVYGDKYAGGFVGYSVDTVYTDSYSEVDVEVPSTSVGNYLGGFAGYLEKTASATVATPSVKNSYASGKIIGVGNYYGGFVGLVNNANSGNVVQGSFAVGLVNNTNSKSGGFVGQMTGIGASNALSSVYFDSTNTGIAISSCLPGSAASGCSGVNTSSQANYFFVGTNLPQSSWDTAKWLFGGSALPTLIPPVLK